jgi:hypothetical protein
LRLRHLRRLDADGVPVDRLEKLRVLSEGAAMVGDNARGGIAIVLYSTETLAERVDVLRRVNPKLGYGRRMARDRKTKIRPCRPPRRR